MALLRDKLFSSVALSHLAVDMLNGQLAVLLTFLSVPLGLTNSLLGFVSAVCVVGGSLTQPIFGYIADRWGQRWLVAGGVFWMAFFYSLVAITPGQFILVLLILASLGSGAFHPAGTAVATKRGRDHIRDRETTSTAYFFLFGQLGLFLGPMLGGLVLDKFNVLGLLMFTSLAVLVGIYAVWQLRPEKLVQMSKVTQKNPTPETKTSSVSQASAEDSPGTAAVISPLMGYGVLSLLAFAMMVAFQAWVQQTMVMFVPKYLSDLGISASIYGMVAAIFVAGSAAGNILGGNLADRFGKRRIATLSLAAASVPLYLFPIVGWSVWLYVLIFLAGALTGATHSIFVVLAQRIFPGGMALASGLVLGFMFASGSLGTLFSGYLADLWSFSMVFRLNAFIVLVAAGLALSMQKN